MGNDNIFKKRREERKRRKENVEILRSSTWLIVCEGEQTEPNYFKIAIEKINKDIDEKYRLKIKIIGMGKNTLSLVKSVEDIQNYIESIKTTVIPYGKIFVVFDKDSFNAELFDGAVTMCEKKGYIPLWSNQAIEFWFLLHFNLIESRMDRTLYATKLNEFFKKSGLNYKYKKNDEKIFDKLCKYGSLDDAIRNATKIHSNHYNDSPSVAESCTTVYKFFNEVKDRLKEIE